MRAKAADAQRQLELTLKHTVVHVFQSLLEGNSDKNVVSDRVVNVIHVDIVSFYCKRHLLDEHRNIKDKVDPELEELEVELRTESVVLLQMIQDYSPTMKLQPDFIKDLDDSSSNTRGGKINRRNVPGTASVEIMWRGKPHRRFFHVPDVCTYLAKSLKDEIVEKVDRSNLENQLIDFLQRSHHLYRQVKHQQMLKTLGLSSIFSRDIFDT
jgi:hypothetical protein